MGVVEQGSIWTRLQGSIWKHLEEAIHESLLSQIFSLLIIYDQRIYNIPIVNFYAVGAYFSPKL